MMSENNHLSLTVICQLLISWQVCQTTESKRVAQKSPKKKKKDVTKIEWEGREKTRTGQKKEKKSKKDIWKKL